MDAADYQKMTDCFARTLELPEGQRDDFLEAACPDEAMREQIRQLLHTAASDPDFLQTAGATIGALRQSVVLGVLGEDQLPEQIGGFRII
ncbi:MAG: hypothetical protein ACF8NJ_10255, partial [Phycisphaerales bacterium JB038]